MNKKNEVFFKPNMFTFRDNCWPSSVAQYKRLQIMAICTLHLHHFFRGGEGVLHNVLGIVSELQNKLTQLKMPWLHLPFNHHLDETQAHLRFRSALLHHITAYSTKSPDLSASSAWQLAPPWRASSKTKISDLSENATGSNVEGRVRTVTWVIRDFIKKYLPLLDLVTEFSLQPLLTVIWNFLWCVRALSRMRAAFS